MNDPRRAFDTFVLYAQTAGLLDDSKPPRFVYREDGFNVLELDPGDSLFSGVIAKSMGATRSWLVDAGAFATHDGSSYARLASFLRSEGYDLTRAGDDVDALLATSCVSYLTHGVTSLHEIPDASVNFCFSNAVLEHVPKCDFKEMTRQLRRVLKPEGVCMYRVDLKDHLGGGLNNMRFSEAIWESSLFHRSGFHTKRIRFMEMLAIFGGAGFDCRTPRIVRWERLPTPKSSMAQPFCEFTDAELQVSGFDVVLRLRADS